MTECCCGMLWGVPAGLGCLVPCASGHRGTGRPVKRHSGPGLRRSPRKADCAEATPIAPSWRRQAGAVNQSQRQFPESGGKQVLPHRNSCFDSFNLALIPTFSVKVDTVKSLRNGGSFRLQEAANCGAPAASGGKGAHSECAPGAAGGAR